MSGGWTRKKLGDAFTTMTGGTPSKADASLFGTYIPLVKPPELLDGTLDSAEDGLSESGARCARTLPADSVLVSCIGNLGKVGLNTVPVAFNQQINAVLPDRAAAMPEFMFYQALSPAFRAQLEALATGTTVRIVNKSKFNEIEIVLAPLSEQHRIVAILDEAFEAIATAKANAEKSLHNAQELLGRISGAVLSQLAPISRMAKLEDVVEPDCSLSYGVVQPGDERADGLPIVRPVDLNCSVVGLDGLKRIDPALAKSYDRTTLKGNDILLCVRGTTGTLALAGSELAGANVTRGIVPIRFDSAQVSQDFGYCLMRSEPVQTQIRAKTYGTALMQINIRDLRQLSLPIPPLQEQGAIVQRLGDVEVAVDQLIVTYERKLTALQELKKSLLHQAFTGKL